MNEVYSYMRFIRLFDSAYKQLTCWLVCSDRTANVSKYFSTRRTLTWKKGSSQFSARISYDYVKHFLWMHVPHICVFFLKFQRYNRWNIQNISCCISSYDFFVFFSLQVRHLNYRRKLYQKILIPRFLCLNDFELWFFLLFFFKKDGGSNLIDKSWFKLMEVIYTV